MQKLKNHIVLLIFALSFNALLAQSNISADVEINAKNLVKEIDNLWHSNTPKALELADEAYLLINKLNESSVKTNVIANKGIAEYTQGQYDEAIKYYLNAYEHAIALSNDPTVYFKLYLTALVRKGESDKVISIIDSMNMIPHKVDSLGLFTAKLSALVELSDLNQLENEFSKKIALPEGSSNYVSFNNSRGKYYQLTNEYDSAKLVFKKNIYHFENKGDSLELANALLEIATVEMDLGEYDSASINIIKSQRIYTNARYQYGIAKTKSLLGNMYAELGQIDLSVENYFQAVKIFESLNTKQELATAYHELAWMYFNQDVEQALDLLTKALLISQEINNKAIEGTVYNYLGALYFEIDSFDDALIAYNKANSIYAQLNLTHRISTVEFNIGALHEAQANYFKALEHYIKTYPLEVKLGNQLGMGINEYAIGHMYSMTNQFEKAKEYLFKSKERLEKIDAKADLIYCLEYISVLYERLNQPSKALEYYKEYDLLKEEIYSLQRESRLAELEMRYTLEGQEQEIKLLNLENKAKEQDLLLQERTIFNQKVFIGLGSLGVLFFAALFILTFRLLKIKNETNKELRELNFEIREKSEEIATQSEELQEANEEIISLNEGLEKKVTNRTEELKNAHKELDTFFYHAAHDFRQPLTTFYGIIKLAQQNLKEEEAFEYFTKISDTTEKMERMVNKLIEISVITSDNLEWTAVDFDTVIEKILTQFKDMIDVKKIAIQKQIAIDTSITSKDLLEIILRNIIENAVVFSLNKEDSFIKVGITAVDNHLQINITDNGQGIPIDLQPKIFDMYFRGSVDSYGNGLGLYITKKALERINGNISFESDVEHGSTFKVSIPLGAA